jgi:hypothetical protein
MERPLYKPRYKVNNKLYWPLISINTETNNIGMVVKRNNKYNLDWNWLSNNPSAIQILERSQGKTQWGYLAYNKNAINYLIKHQNKINWNELINYTDATINCMYILQNNNNKLNWIPVNEYTEFLKYDYYGLRIANQVLKEELIQVAMHPNRISKWLDDGIDIDDI